MNADAWGMLYRLTRNIGVGGHTGVRPFLSPFREWMSRPTYLAGIDGVAGAPG